MPAVEALGRRVSRNLERLTGAIAAAALVVGGAMLVLAPLGGFHHVLGETMVVVGILGTFVVAIGALRRDNGRRG
jgi:ubiquinone biosynthesis protein